jgi:hypothetical protein
MLNVVPARQTGIGAAADWHVCGVNVGGRDSLDSTRRNGGMSQQSGSKPNRPATDDFQHQAEGQQPGLLGELLYMVRRDKQWWLVPILLMLLLLSVLVYLGGTAAAPFIYTLF